MPDKFENATLLLRIRLPSTLIHIKRSTKTELFENALQSGTIWKRYFFVLVWTENFLYPQLFEYADIILSCNLSSQVINMAKNMIFWNFESKQPPKTLLVWTQNICSVFALKVAFSNLSGIVWTRPKKSFKFDTVQSNWHLGFQKKVLRNTYGRHSSRAKLIK